MNNIISKFIIRYVELVKIIALILVMLLFLIACTDRTKEYPDGFYKYNESQFDDLINSADIINFNVWSHGIERDSRGTSIRISDVDAREKFVISCDGTIKNIKLPSSNCWLNDDNEIIAWEKEGLVYYKNGYSESGKMITYHGTDPSGKYFWKKIGNSNLGVFDIDHPSKPIIELEAFKLRIFAEDNEIHIFAMKKSRDIIWVYIFRVENSEIIKISEHSIKRNKSGASPFWIVDYNINTGDVIIVDVWDRPYRSKWYMYNINERHLKNIGKSFDFGFFMQCDVVSKVLSNLENSE